MEMTYLQIICTVAHSKLPAMNIEPTALPSSILEGLHARETKNEAAHQTTSSKQRPTQPLSLVIGSTHIPDGPTLSVFFYYII